MLANRVRKNVKKLEAWLKRDGVTCYRAYDADIPEYNLALDVYGGAVHVQEYARPKTVDPKLAEQRLRDAVLLSPSLFGVKPEDVFLKVRRRSPEDAPALPKVGEDLEVTEGGLKFWVNLADHLDTGLFLDHRSVRAWLRAQAKERDFLNLFAYTSTATVYAAAGGAKSSVSVDLSRSYLEWGRRNMALNGLDGPQHRFESEDVGEWLQRDERKFDLIFAAPPIYSRSKRAEEFDVQRDHVTLIELAMARLRPGGLLLFSNPLQSFKLDQEALAAYRPEDLSSKLLPPDFARNPHIHATWKFQR
jgi:23S rRNA (guanine2445-N2)-methyltransferase / 23S rRNA (guanine2069-N7)-methyltransferase